LIFLENLTDLVLWLLLTVLWVNLLFLGFLAYRRVIRLRYYEAKDAARERYSSLIAQFATGDVTPAATATVLRNATTEPELDAIHDILFSTASEDPEAVTELLIALGSVERWAREAFGRKRGPQITVRALHREKVALPKSAGSKDVLASLNGLRFRSVHRAKAVNYLGHLAPAVALAFDAEALQDPSPEVRRLALTALGRNGHPGAIPLIVEELDRGLGRGSDISLRSAKSALVGYQMADLHHFVPYLNNANPRLRFFMIDAVRDICKKSTARGMLNKNDFPIELYQICLDELVHDDNPDVRARTAGVIRYFRDTRSASALRVLLRDENEFVRLHAVRACSDRHAPGFMVDLAERLGDMRWRVREAAVKGLIVFGSSGEDQLFRYFISATDRYACEQLAEEMQRAGMVPALMDVLGSNDPRADLASGVFQKLVLLEKDSMLLQGVTSPELPESSRLRLLDIVTMAARAETYSALAIVAESDAGPVGDKAAMLLQEAQDAGIPGSGGFIGAAGAAGAGAG
jgi:HEAT repeat protein